MSLVSIGAAGQALTSAQNSTINSSYQSQMAAAQNSITTGFTVAQPTFQEGQHIFNCQRVENGWTLNYRHKQYIATTLDELMEQMKAAMVIERIEK